MVKQKVIFMQCLCRMLCSYQNSNADNVRRQGFQERSTVTMWPGRTFCKCICVDLNFLRDYVVRTTSLAEEQVASEKHKILYLIAELLKILLVVCWFFCCWRRHLVMSFESSAESAVALRSNKAYILGQKRLRRHLLGSFEMPLEQEECLQCHN